MRRPDDFDHTVPTEKNLRLVPFSFPDVLFFFSRSLHPHLHLVFLVILLFQFLTLIVGDDRFAVRRGLPRLRGHSPVHPPPRHSGISPFIPFFFKIMCFMYYFHILMDFLCRLGAGRRRRSSRCCPSSSVSLSSCFPASTSYSLLPFPRNTIYYSFMTLMLSILCIFKANPLFRSAAVARARPSSACGYFPIPSFSESSLLLCFDYFVFSPFLLC